jgi:ATP-dependent DNA ligase
MMDKGYKRTIEEATRSNSNQLGLEQPMLAHPRERVTNINYRGAVYQKKLDGHRCLITKVGGEVIAYSRKGKLIPAIRHIVEPLQDVIPEGCTLDGELYFHGQKLQTLASWIKREQEETKKLNFVCYDTISDQPYIERHANIRGMLEGLHSKIVVLPYTPYTNEENMQAALRSVRKAGFEGLMLRIDGRGYECNKRSSSLIKIKVFQDAEFVVVDINPSEKGWAVCTCVTESGKLFGVSAPGSIDEKTEVLRNKDKYIGRKLKVEYGELTADGIPFHCSALEWWEDV